MDDLLISTESAEGFIAASDYGLTVVLDTTVTDELYMEGIERELISKIQSMRKEAGFNVVDRIELYYLADGDFGAVLEKYGADIANAVLANKLEKGANIDGAYEKEWEVNGEKFTLAVKKAD